MHQQSRPISPASFVDNLTHEQKVQLRGILNTLCKFIGPKSLIEEDGLSFHVGPQTKCEIKFKGPVTIDEWDALLAHIAFYKTWYKDADKNDIRAPTADQIADAVMRALSEEVAP